MGILLTGATGFIGGAIAANLAARGLLGDTQFTVRCNSPEAGLGRLRENLSRFSLEPATLNLLRASQVIPFDLSDATVPPLGSPEVLINCAALATFSNHPQLWDTNVDGVVRFARAAAAVPSLKRFIQLGTAMSCGIREDKHVKEDWHVPPRSHHVVPYTYSKGMAELALRSEIGGLPLVVVRPSIVVGHSELGCKPSGSIFWLFRIVATLKAFSTRLGDRIDVLSVDDCAEGILRLALQPRLQYDLYHLSSGEEGSELVSKIYPAMRGARRPDDMARELAEYSYLDHFDEKALARRFIEITGEGNVRLVARAIHLYSKFARMNYIFDNTRLVQDTGFAPRSLSTYIDKCLATSADESILQQMQWDYK